MIEYWLYMDKEGYEGALKRVREMMKRQKLVLYYGATVDKKPLQNTGQGNKTPIVIKLQPWELDKEVPTHYMIYGRKQ